MSACRVTHDVDPVEIEWGIDECHRVDCGSHIVERARVAAPWVANPPVLDVPSCVPVLAGISRLLVGQREVVEVAPEPAMDEDDDWEWAIPVGSAKFNELLWRVAVSNNPPDTDLECRVRYGGNGLGRRRCPRFRHVRHSSL